MILRIVLLLFVSQVFSTDLKQCLVNKKSTAEIVEREDETFPVVNRQVIVTKPILPIGYVFVKTTEDVKKVIECGTQLDIHVAIQSGGHSEGKYSFGTNDSWVISTSLMNKTQFNDKEKTVTVGTGIRAGQLIDIMWNYCKCIIPLGVCPDVGIAGFALGGGYSIFSRKYGMLVDNVIEMEVVTADAKVRRVNKDKDSDLYWALRGAGGGNFGVVTEFTIRYFEAAHTYIWIVKKYPPEMYASVLKQWHKWLYGNIDSSVGSIIYLSFMELTVWFSIIESNDQEAMQQLQTIMKYIPSINQADIFSGNFMDQYKAQMNPSWTNSYDNFVYTKTRPFYVDKHLLDEDIDVMVKLIQDFPFFIHIDAYGGAINRRQRQEMAFVHRDSLYHSQVTISIGIDENENVTEMILIGDEFNKKINDAYIRVQFMDNGESYQNYISEDISDWFHRYYKENGEQLRRVKSKYDGNDFFRFDQSIKPFKSQDSKSEL